MFCISKCFINFANRKRALPRAYSFAQWYQYMGTYVTALMIVGCRLTPGYVLSHMNVMGQIMEQLQLKRNVAQKAAFMVISLYSLKHIA